MVTRGKIRGNGKQLADYLLRQGENDHIRVLDITGTNHPGDLKKSLMEMSLLVELSRRTKKGLYQVVINPAPAESYRMTDEDWIRAAEILEQHTGFTGQPRAMVIHEKDNRRHCHVVWSRYDFEKGRVLSNRFSRYKQNDARRQMETEFAHLRTPDHNIDRPALRKLVTALWREHPTGTAFIKALEAHGHTVALSDESHPFRLVNEWGRDFDLVREITGARKKQVAERLKGIPLPDKKQAIKRIRQVQRAQGKATNRQQQMHERMEQLQRKPARNRGR